MYDVRTYVIVKLFIIRGAQTVKLLTMYLLSVDIVNRHALLSSQAIMMSCVLVQVIVNAQLICVKLVGARHCRIRTRTSVYVNVA